MPRLSPPSPRLGGAWREPRGRCRGVHRHEPCVHRRHRREPAKGPDHLRQIPCRQTDQRGRRRGAPGRAEEPQRTQQEPLPVAQEPAEPVRPPAHPTGKPLRLESQDRSGIPYAPSLPGALRPARRRGQRLPEKMVLLGHAQPSAPMVEAARMVKRHWDGILRWFQSKIANGIMEAINSLVQAAKAKARGYRSMRNLKAVIYLIAGKMELALPT